MPDLPDAGRGALMPCIAGALAVLAVLAGILRLPDWSLFAVFAIALSLGAVFVRCEHGFTAGYRQFLTSGDGRALAASFVVPAVATLIVLPVGASVEGYSRFLAPIGPSLVVGAFLFGIGMQTANACGSGTLIAAGQGSRRAWITLPFFALGNVLGTLILPLALRLPGLGTIDLTEALGIVPALLAIEATLLIGGLVIARGAKPSRERVLVSALIGALAGLLFLASREPWGVTMGLTVWGAKALRLAGLDVAGFEWWRDDGARALLDGPALAMHGSLTDVGLLLGAFLAAAAKGRVRFGPPIGRRAVAGAVVGGLLMGVGARLSFGCNVGAFLGGVSSGSVHGLVWFLAVLPGLLDRHAFATGVRVRAPTGDGRETFRRSAPNDIGTTLDGRHRRFSAMTSTARTPTLPSFRGVGAARLLGGRRRQPAQNRPFENDDETFARRAANIRSTARD